MLGVGGLCIAGVGAVAAGAVNALAGGGTLITFPLLTALGLPPVAANVTNTLALGPGYLGGVLAQSADLRGQKSRFRQLLPSAAVGGVVGGLLLLNTGERVFNMLVPFLLLLASLLLATQGKLRRCLQQRNTEAAHHLHSEKWAALPIGLAAIYGGYFGGGMSVIVLAVLGIALEDSLTRLNTLKQAISLCVTIATSVLFCFSGQVDWVVAAVMAVGSLIGGALGGRLAARIRPDTLRWSVVAIGVIISIVYLVC
jgi:uncharacterized membrane protein YfcA